MDLQRLTEVLSAVPGVQAVALGGSQSRGESDAQSDYDLGVYYSGAELDAQRLSAVLQTLDDEHRDNLLNPPGCWGPWVNGGGWLCVDETPVDILLRDTAQVAEVLHSCAAGTITIDYQCGHPFGFVNTIYAAETHFCVPLWQDAARVLDELKAILRPDGGYPEPMRRAVMEKFMWEASFSMMCGKKAALRGDTHYALGSLFRTAGAWLQALYACNRRYLMNEKKSLVQADALAIQPEHFRARVEELYLLSAQNFAEDAYPKMEAMHAELEQLCMG